MAHQTAPSRSGRCQQRTLVREHVSELKQFLNVVFTSSFSSFPLLPGRKMRGGVPVPFGEVLSDCSGVAGAGEGHETSVYTSCGGLERGGLGGTDLLRELVSLGLSQWFSTYL